MILLFLLAIILIIVLGTIFSWQWAYSRLRPYLQTKEDRKLVLKGSVILTVVAVAFALAVKYMQSEPAYFEQGIEQLHTSKYIKDRIERFSSYTFNEQDLSKEPKSPAVFHVQINGDSLTLYLTCTMSRIKDTWKLSQIKEDSISKTR